MQTFYHGLISSTRESIDTAAGGAFLSLKLSDAKALVEKMASNSTCNEELTQPWKKGGGINYRKEADMVTTKLDLIMKKLDIKKKEVMHINDSHMTCEECGHYVNLAVSCPTLQEDVNFINNNTTIILNKIKGGTNNLDKVITKVTTEMYSGLTTLY